MPRTTAQAIAASLAPGIPDLEDEAALEDWLHTRSATEQAHLCPQQTLVEHVSNPLQRLQLNLAPHEAVGELSLTIRWENGAVSQVHLNSPRLKSLATPGYHQVTIQTAHRSASFLWILSPGVCYLPDSPKKSNGINCFLPSLQSGRNWGCGDFTDLANFARILRAQVSFDFIALNPLHAIHNRVPYNTSPYLPLSIFSYNLLYLDIEKIPAFEHCPLAQRIVRSAEFQERLRALRAAEWIDYEAVARIKRFFLALLYRASRKQKVASSSWVSNYCTYMAFDRYFHRRDATVWHWRQWPEPYQNPQSPESQRLQQKLQRSIGFFAFIEACAEQQLQDTQTTVRQLGYSIGLYHDLALATDRVGADHWAYQELFAPHVRVGSPPDDFNEAGQDWGFPALHPQRHANSGYRYFIESIRSASRHGGALRFDHVMRLARLYWIPDGVSAREGAYVRDHFRDLLLILALESQRGGYLVIGEDLGTMPDYFREALNQFQILSYRLLLFERDSQGFHSAERFPMQAIASFTTHDLPTFDGWLAGSDLRARLEAGTMPESELEPSYTVRRSDIRELATAFTLPEGESNRDAYFDALCRFLVACPSRLTLLNLEEITGEELQQNLPGTTTQHPNWRRRCSVPIEAFLTQERTARRLQSWAAASVRGLFS
ncbi:4-alpha-glucanotransferase [Bryobacter aggregatus]|uniref:4-alpha-glucanotransferase n=1 Tax=Bryobacter aggregatus TaxID=360054 RepID=UPI00068F8CAD|nr:4-alpha-glucanotransferase [Bryobacter aggregatus]